MKALFSFCVRGLVVVLQALPLDVVARLGRVGGLLAFWFDARHRRVARRNLALCFPGQSAAAIRALARETFQRIGENFACAAKTASMSGPELAPRLRVVGAGRVRLTDEQGGRVRNLVCAIGHFGNFEVYARAGSALPGFQFATTYRALAHPAFDAVMMTLRRQSGCLYFERRTDAAALKEALAKGGIALGLLADQNAGRRGVRIPFLGPECYTSIAPAVLALRYEAPLHTAICYRIGLARWEIEFGTEIPLRENGQPRSSEAIMREVNAALEAAVRRDPANWFWVHNRWRAEKPGKMRKTKRATSTGRDLEDPAANDES